MICFRPLFRKFLAVSLSVSFALLEADFALAHSGGLNASGCHAGSRPYHCHRSPSQMVRTRDGRNRIRCDLGSRSRECVGRGSSRNDINVLNLQIQLRRHCRGLPSGFADGIPGQNTIRALKAFQRSVGLQADGILGPNTRRALANAPNGQCRVGN